MFVSRDRKDSELIIGIITTVGTDTEQIIGDIKDQLGAFRYHTEEVNVSKEIISQFEAAPTEHWDSEADRISYYMDKGNEARIQTDDNAVLMKGVARKIFLSRDRDPRVGRLPKPRMAYIIKSIKHEDEVEFLRDTYGDGFYLIGITSSYQMRLNNLVKRKRIKKDVAVKLLERDENEELEQGQHTRDAFQHADYFINVTENTDQNYNSVQRLIDLIFGNPFLSPSFDEYAMFMAYASSLRSADLSRQVGAVVARDNEILSMGANDCPRFGGGLYWPESHDDGTYNDVPDGRDYMLGYDSNKVEQNAIIESLLSEFSIELSPENRQKAKHAGIGDLTEYGRVVHGEMEALLACARNHISCRGATMYVTTFPCHNCAKHIIAAGIRRVVYIEPYPKSKAFQFYKIEISDSIPDEHKVVFEPFTGVGPQRFSDLFSMSSPRWYLKKRKESDGTKLDWQRGTAELRTPISLLNYLASEESAVINFEDELRAIRKEDKS